MKKLFINLYCGLVANKTRRRKIRRVLLDRDRTEFLEQQNAELLNSVKLLETEKQNLLNKISSLETQNTELQNQNSIILTQLNDFQHEIEVLNQQNAELSNNIKLLESQNKDLLSQYNILSDKLNDFNVRYKMAENQIKYMQALNKSSKQKRNLFVSTGLISSINAMSIIKQLKLKNNDLIIYSFSLTDKFKDFAMRLVLSGFFDNILFMDNNDFTSFINYNNILDYAEIFLPDQPGWRDWYSKHPKYNLIEEGISSYFDFGTNDDNLNGLQRIMLSEYHGLKYQNNAMQKFVVPISLPIQQEIIENIRKQNKIDFKYLNQPDQVMIMYNYVIQIVFTDEEIIDFYKDYINKLLKCGYKVLFKSHPRTNDSIITSLSKEYHDNKSVNFVPDDTKWPIELLINDIKPCATVSVMSGAGLSIQHIFGIPAYNIEIPNREFPSELNFLNWYKKLFEQNMPNIDAFFDNKN